MKEEEIKNKIDKWIEWCNNDEDDMNDHLRDFFNEQLELKDLWFIIEHFKSKK